jgi:prolyl-tRNA synthetase
LQLQQANTRPIDSLDEFREYFTPENEEKPEIHGGFALCHWSEDPAVDQILKDMKVTIRCVPLAGEQEPGKCIFTGQPSGGRAVFAKAY